MAKSALEKLDLIQKGLLKNKCAICGLGPEWNKKELILVLDYVNGLHSDERIVNLRLLCPNCNSQQYNPIIKYKMMKKSNPKKPCNRCGMPCSINTESGLCKKCVSIIGRKTEWPSPEQLKEDMKELSWSKIGIKYGVSDHSVKRWAKIYGLIGE